MTDPVTYGSTDDIPLKVTLNGVGVTGLTFDAADIQLSKDGGAFAAPGGSISEIGLGWYKLTPTIADTSCNYGIINIKDDVGSLFDENAVVFYTGNNATSGRFGA